MDRSHVLFLFLFLLGVYDCVSHRASAGSSVSLGSGVSTSTGLSSANAP